MTNLLPRSSLLPLSSGIASKALEATEAASPLLELLTSGMSEAARAAAKAELTLDGSNLYEATVRVTVPGGIILATRPNLHTGIFAGTTPSERTSLSGAERAEIRELVAEDQMRIRPDTEEPANLPFPLRTTHVEVRRVLRGPTPLEAARDVLFDLKCAAQFFQGVLDGLFDRLGRGSERRRAA